MIVCTLLDYAPGGDLFERLYEREEGFFREHEVQVVIGRLLHAVVHLHDVLNIVHRGMLHK